MAWPLRLAGLLALLPVGLFSEGGQAPDRGGRLGGEELPRLHLVTFMNEVHRLFAVLQTSAEAHGLHPQILGYGKVAWWPDGLGVKINMLRDFAFSQGVRGEDVVVFADAFDVLVLAGEEEILNGFLEEERRLGSSLLFNAEPYCFPALGGICEDYPSSPTRWRYLNSGLIVGRAWAFRRLLRDPVPDVIEGGDQAWYQRQFRFENHSDLIALDRECRFVCAVVDSESSNQVVLSDHRMVRMDTGFRPPLVHFCGVGHWVRWPRGREMATSVLADIFRLLYPDVAKRMIDIWSLELHIGSTHDIRIFKGPGLWSVMQLVLCVQCNVLGTGQRECEYFHGFLCPRCIFWSLLALSCCVLVPLSCVLVARLAAGRRSLEAAACWKRQRKASELMV